jgi:hypothetical protein
MRASIFLLLISLAFGCDSKSLTRSSGTTPASGVASPEPEITPDRESIFYPQDLQHSLAAALEKAKAEEKRVFIHYTGRY